MLDCTSSSLIDAAERETGLSDFGTDDFRSALDILIRSMGEEAGLNERGMAWQLDELAGLLAVRLRIHDWVKRHPAIRDQRIIAPVVIVGLQRSGTSKLFRMIAHDPQWNVLRTWQALQPVPLTDPPAIPDPRLSHAAQWCAERSWMQHVHSFEVDAPEMEALLLKQDFMIHHPARIVPTHRRWCETADFVPAYRNLKLNLQFLQWQNGWEPGRRWVLKSPPHLLSLLALKQVFPDATLVMTHRHPRASLGSMLSLVRLAQAQSARLVDIDAIRTEWTRILTLSTEKFLQACDLFGAEGFVHVPFARMMDDPAGVVRDIYQRADVPFGEASADAVASWNRSNPQHKDGKHSYDLSDFGLTADDVEELFAAYLARFGSAVEMPRRAAG